MRATRLLWILALSALAGLFPLAASETPVQGELLTKKGDVEATGPQTNWAPAPVGLQLRVQDRIRTRALSQATLRLAELGRLSLDELTTLEILPPSPAAGKATLNLRAGAVYFFTREKPREFLLQTPYAIGASRGTEFLTVVEPSGRTVLTVFDGEVELANARGTLRLTNGEQGTVQAGQAPVKTAVLQTTQLVQWWLYYPGVLDPGELEFTPTEKGALARSLAAYAAGGLAQALEAYPAGRSPRSEAERVYYAGLLLSVGQADKAEAMLAAVPPSSPQARALRRLIAVVTGAEGPPGPAPTLASEWLAWSYAQQRTNLFAALQSALRATEKSPGFSFAWERVAELEFSFGRIEPAGSALRRALKGAPRNAQALALHGFILSAQNRIAAAREAFDQAIQADGNLANGWLGRGLCRIRQGDAAGGRADLQTAAAVESNRSLLRSYLGKAFGALDDERHARLELALARRLDPNDPTPWLYSALLNLQDNRINEGISELERSQELNDHRNVYRSRLLLDQDRAVRGAGLATIYERAGMEEAGFREAARAVAYDYGNYSAHLFLANSLDALRDPTRFNVRYETAWFNELLLANLLAPVGAGTLSQNISQQEYARLFEADRLGLITDSSWRSDRQFHQAVTQCGTYRDSSYSLDVDYQHNDGVRPNNALSRLAWNAAVKEQWTPRDALLVWVLYKDYHAGDNFQYYNPKTAALLTNFDYYEREAPILAAGYHREWAPGMHTLLLGARLSEEQHYSEKAASGYLLIPADPGNRNPLNILQYYPFDIDFRNDFEIYSAELNQIFQTERQTLVLGGRAQAGEVHAQDTVLASDPGSRNDFAPPPNHSIQEDFNRVTAYGYYTLQLPTHLGLTAGLAYDQMRYPRDFLYPPLAPGELARTRIEPKAALVWTPAPAVTFRAAYARSLGGISFDESFRLEPVQLAGFSQAFPNVMPESVVGGVAAPTFETAGAAVDLRFKTGTYLGLQGQLLDSQVTRTLGDYVFDPVNPIPAGAMPERLDYHERTITANLNQLAGEDWSFGVRYQFTYSDLAAHFPQVPPPASFPANGSVHAYLHQVSPYLVFNHPSGLFARAEAPWYSQQNFGYSPGLPGDAFFQVNLLAGYRFPRQLGELTVGLLNATGTDYHLNPLNLYGEMPRERVWYVRLRLNF